MTRTRKKLEKRAAQLLIQSGIFDANDWDDLNLCFWSNDYWGESNEISAWDYLYDLAVESTIDYVSVDWDSGYYTEFGKKCDLSIIEAFRIFRINYVSKTHRLT